MSWCGGLADQPNAHCESHGVVTQDKTGMFVVLMHKWRDDSRFPYDKSPDGCLQRAEAA